MKIGLITGRRASELVKKFAELAEKKVVGAELEVIVIPINVIGLVNTDAIASIIASNEQLARKLRENDVILVPGTVRGDVSVIEKVVGKPVYKASRSVSLLTEVVKSLLSGVSLSKTLPAEDVLKDCLLRRIASALERFNREAICVFSIGRLKVPLRGPPTLLAAETSVSLPPEKAGEQAKYFEESGADIVVIGIPLGENRDVYTRRIKSVTSNCNRAVIAVDSENPHAIIEGFKHGAEIAFGLHAGNMDILREYRKKTFVVIPGNTKTGVLPRNSKETVEMLMKNLEKARKLGYEKLIADPILQPPLMGLVDSIVAYKELSNKLSVPLALSTSNVTELLDADSVGVNALLSCIAVELGASLVHVSEESWRARWSVSEVKLGLLLACAARDLHQFPVDVGIDLFVAKEKEKPEPPTINWKEPGEKEVIDTRSIGQLKAKLDKWGHVVIEVDHDEKVIIVCIEKRVGESRKCYIGDDATKLMRKVLNDHREFSIEHAGYLGMELAKAMIALKLGKKYVQDSDVIETPFEKYFTIKKHYNF